VASRRAVLLTAKAMDVLDADPQTARTAALEAHKLRPDFVPAAVTAARALFRQNELRKGSKVLETVWKKEPHPEIADVYIHARPGDSTHDRLARAKKLQSLKRNNVESALIVGRAALDAGEFQLARESCEAAARLGPRESVYLLMADIEEAETGDQGRVRQWLAKALRAPRDPAWVADGYVAERWAPISPVTGKLDAFEWRMPMERLAQVVESEEDFSPAPSIPAPKEEPETAEAETVVIEAETVKPEPAAKPQEPEKPSEPSPETAKTPPQPPEPPAKPAPVNGQKAAPGEAEEPVKPPIPDDPGVEPDDKDASTSGRFRLF
ncbi:heme biosynthesis protein HemY, partial [Nitratireductor aquimarinus]|nr:heme biosynthesis protein HemY [Nitratireductor aquimarinus]